MFKMLPMRFGKIDWKLVQEVNEFSFAESNYHDYLKSGHPFKSDFNIVVTPHNYQVYVVVELCKNLNAMSKFPNPDPDSLEDRTFLQYFSCHYNIEDPSFPLIAVKHLYPIKNYLIARDDVEMEGGLLSPEEDPRTLHLIAETASLLPFNMTR